MHKYLIDVNLPYKVAFWHSDEFIHQTDLDDQWSDDQIWNYAKENNLTIVTKDADFSNKIIFQTPPPRVIHIKIGNMKFKVFYDFIAVNWSKIEKISNSHKLTNVFNNRIEGIE